MSSQPSRFRVMFEAELAAHDITWCTGKGCRSRGSNHRGFTDSITPQTVHFDSQIGTRTTLFGGLHEIGHVVCGHNVRGRGGKRRWEAEAEATTWAMERMRELGVPVPEKVRVDYANYIDRMRRWGDNVAAAQRGRSKR